MNKQEAQKQIEEQRDMILGLYSWGAFGYIEGMINQLDDPPKIEIPKVEFKKSPKIKVPQFVADWIEEVKENGFEVKTSLGIYAKVTANTDVYTVMNYIFKDEHATNKVLHWVDNNRATFARAWLDGYEVEKEPKYTVMVKGVPGYGRYLNKALLSKEYFFASENEVSGYRTKHTRKELEEAGFGWVFDCEGIEIEEDTD